VLATVLIGRKSWIGLVLAALNSAIVCVIGFRTAQFGFIPANLFCICVYAVSVRSWLRTRAENLQTESSGNSVGDPVPVAQSAS
jgi:hypothetical protein